MKSFEEALHAAIAGVEGTEHDPAPLAAALRDVAVKLPLVDNLGVTGDGRDMYPLIDDVAAGARALYPEILCKAGCSACCHYPVSLYTIAESEWRPMAEYVARHWSQERLVAFVTRFWETHGPYLWRLRVLNFLMEIPLPVLARREAIPLACPFLEDDRCAVYEARPVIARAFGLFSFKHFFLRMPVLYGCDTAQAHMRPILARGDRRPLPSFNPLFGVRSALARGRRLLIPLWVARQWPRSWLRDAGTEGWPRR